MRRRGARREAGGEDCRLQTLRLNSVGRTCLDRERALDDEGKAGGRAARHEARTGRISRSIRGIDRLLEPGFRGERPCICLRESAVPIVQPDANDRVRERAADDDVEVVVAVHVGNPDG